VGFVDRHNPRRNRKPQSRSGAPPDRIGAI
jgi:hypothetical protein